MSKTIFLKLTSAVAIDGAICRKGSIVEVSEAEAKNFLHRGKAVLATAEDGAPEGDDDQLDVSKLNKAQLLPLAEELGIEGADKMKVDDLRAAIESANSEAE
ncbi:hypothetical protein [Pseudomonas phage PPpW-3]|uniref:Ribosomal protein L9 domain-containing protein n=1 Tax=Pseudomonas phage PPpW-3 TaxID=1279082 RepID=V5YUM4_9CAUD|nr:endonuclease VII [Pseudomonas phage PPpW-3]BAO20606.1 hypothetical protein [Pseudomonas phage PPpW-3]